MDGVESDGAFPPKKYERLPHLVSVHGNMFSLNAVFFTHRGRKCSTVSLACFLLVCLLPPSSLVKLLDNSTRLPTNSPSDYEGFPFQEMPTVTTYPPAVACCFADMGKSNFVGTSAYSCACNEIRPKVHNLKQLSDQSVDLVRNRCVQSAVRVEERGSAL